MMLFLGVLQSSSEDSEVEVGGVLQKRWAKKFSKIDRKTPVSQSLF